MVEAGVTYAFGLRSYLESPHRPGTADVLKAIKHIDNLGVVAGIRHLRYRERDRRELADCLDAGIVREGSSYDRGTSPSTGTLTAPKAG